MSIGGLLGCEEIGAGRGRKVGVVFRTEDRCRGVKKMRGCHEVR